MDNEYIAAEHEMKSAAEALNIADRSRADSSTETRKGLAEYYDKILLYSAGAFSFQVTLLQFVPDKHVLAHVGILGQPNAYVMYASLLLYLVTAASILLAKKLDTYYVNANASEHYRDKFIKDREAKIAFFSKYPGQIIVQGGVDNQLATYKSDITKVKDIIAKDKRDSKFYYKLMIWTHNFLEVTVILATVLLYVFAIELAQSLVW